MTLWFENSVGEERIIAEVKDWQDVWKSIDNFINECNAKKPRGVKPFKSYYSRIYKIDNGRTKIDVGSHTEFFSTDLEYDTVKDDS